ncbi:glucose-6-phosphate isomerase [Kineosporia corallincola]|uniref:glucose-6-phosphate isomerase n=1 Tax=Kineosporia corallincola TaxID=2835133 RepID=UPI00355800D2
MTVTPAGADALKALEKHLSTLVADKVASRIAGKDATLWGDAAVSEASVRLGWVGLADTSRPLVEPIEALRAELLAEGVDRVVLCGMGGSSLAPEVITKTAGVDLVVLDTTDPGQVRSALVELERTVIVVSSKSGGTVETDSQRRVFEAAFTAAGIDAKRRIVVVTDPGSPLEKASNEAGYRAVFSADPTIGGRYSALTAFGLVPSGLAGVDVGALLDEAAAVSDQLAEDVEANPGLVLGAVLGGSPTPGSNGFRDKVVFADYGSGINGFGDWAEQLIAESTGKEGTGLLPVVASPQAPDVTAPADDTVVVRLAPIGSDATTAPTASDAPAAVTVNGPLGAQFLLWEYATAVAGRLIGINPFDQPDVESAKAAARGLLDATPEPEPADAVDGGIEIRATPGLLNGATTVEAAVDALLAQLPGRGYLAVMAYLDRLAESELEGVRDPLAKRTGRPVTFGWGPRFLHSTGQFHKGGAPVGVYLQITADSAKDLEIPDRPFTFGKLIGAQAAGDATVLAQHDRPVLRLHLADREAGLAELIRVLSR